MAAATIAKINAGIAQYGVEIVKGNGYFYFAELDDRFVAQIPSVYSCHLRCMSLEDWIEHVASHARQ